MESTTSAEMLRRSTLTDVKSTAFLIPPLTDKDLDVVLHCNVELVKQVEKEGFTAGTLEYLARPTAYREVGRSQKEGGLKVDLAKHSPLPVPLIDVVRNCQRGRASYSTPSRNLTSRFARMRGYYTAE